MSFVRIYYFDKIFIYSYLLSKIERITFKRTEIHKFLQGKRTSFELDKISFPFRHHAIQPKNYVTDVVSYPSSSTV